MAHPSDVQATRGGGAWCRSIVRAAQPLYRLPIAPPESRSQRLYKGPRDRLYRTGDLGQYLPSGAVRVSGRIDSQVKIRGFRIELNEIDTNLSGSPLIRDYKTLIRRDRNEEPTLVSYIVPEIAEWKRWLEALSETEKTIASQWSTLIPGLNPKTVKYVDQNIALQIKANQA